MQLSRSLSVLLFSSSVMNLPAAAAAQDARPQPTGPIFSVQSPTPASRAVWLLDVSYNTASRSGASSDCDELQEQARSTGGTVLCSADSRVPAWSAAGGLMFLDRVGFKVGYLDYGDIALHAAGDNTTMGPRPGQDGRTSGHQHDIQLRRRARSRTRRDARRSRPCAPRPRRAVCRAPGSGDGGSAK